jgi:hypothetical protein
MVSVLSMVFKSSAPPIKRRALLNDSISSEVNETIEVTTATLLDTVNKTIRIDI